MPARVLVADHRPLLREALVRALDGCSGLEVVGDAPDGRTALAAIRRLRPEVAVLDADLRGLGGVELLGELAGEGAGVAAVLLTEDADPPTVHEAVAAGARAVIAKDADAATVCEAVNAAADGHVVLSAAAQEALAAEVRRRAADPGPSLTERERDVLHLVAEGCSTEAIGRRLHLSPSTVKTHLSALFRKLGVSDRAAAVAEAMRRGLLR